MPRFSMEFDIAVAYALLALVLVFGVVVLFGGHLRTWWEDWRATKWEHQRFAQTAALINQPERRRRLQIVRHSDGKDAA